MRGGLFALAVLVAPALGCDRFSAAGDEAEGSSRPATSSRPRRPIPGSARKPVIVYEMSDEPTAPTDYGLIERPQAAVKACEATLGKDTKLTWFILYPDRAAIRTRDPDRPGHERRFEFRGGVLRELDDKLGFETSEEMLSQREVSLVGVDWSAMPRLTKDALRRYGEEGSRISHAALVRPVLAKHAEIRFYVTGNTSTGSVDYTPSGDFVELSRR